MARTPAAPRSGRPKDIARREAIIKASRELFTSQPFNLVTMEAVAARAGVSKMTVYSHFRDKEALFETIVLATSDQMISALSASEPEGGLRERLIAVGTVFLGVILGSDICKMAHTLPGALRANRDLADRFYAAGPGRVRAALAAIVAAAAERGELTVDDPDGAADDLVSLWEGSMPAKIAFGLAELSTPEEIRRRARRGTDVFLRAYRPEVEAAPPLIAIATARATPRRPEPTNDQIAAVSRGSAVPAPIGLILFVPEQRIAGSMRGPPDPIMNALR